MSSDDIDYLKNHLPRTLYVNPGKDGAYATLVSEDETILGEIEVTPRSRLAVSAFYVNDKTDYGTFKLTKLTFHKTYGWREDGSRLDAVEEFIERAVGRYTNAKKRLTYTVGAELGNIIGTGQLRWTVESASNIPTVARQIFESFKSVALPYYENASSAEKVYALLKSEGRKSWIHCPINLVRAKTVLALAFLLNQNHDIEPLEKEYIKHLSDLNDPGLSKFIDFAKSIKSLSRENLI